jgi:lipoprotein
MIKLTKMIALAVAVLIGLSACNPKKNEPRKGLIPTTDLLVHIKSSGARSLRAEDGKPFKSARSVEDCMKRLNMLFFYLPNTTSEATLGIKEEDKLYDTHTIRIYSNYIITERGELLPDFIDGHDFIFYDARKPKEVVGYIPNAVMSEAGRKIKEAYKAGNHEEVYRLMQEAFVAYPLTDAEYKALKAEGKL